MNSNIKNLKFHDGSNIQCVKFPEELNHIRAIGNGKETIVNTGYIGDSETEFCYLSQYPDKSEDKRKLPSINEVIEEAIEDRFDDIANTKILSNKRYLEARSKMNELYEQVSDIIPAESKKMLIEYSDAKCRLSIIESTLFYKQGLRDGMALPKAWGGIR